MRGWGGGKGKGGISFFSFEMSRLQVQEKKGRLVVRAVGVGHEHRPWRIVLQKVAYHATSSARNFAKLYQNYARIPKLCS